MILQWVQVPKFFLTKKKKKREEKGKRESGGIKKGDSTDDMNCAGASGSVYIYI